MSTLASRYEAMASATRSSARSDSAPILTESDISALPTALRRYIARSGALGRPRPRTITADFDARMWRSRESAPLELRTRQTNRFAEPTRHFFLEGSMFALPVRGLHSYAHADATMLVRVAGLFPVAKAEGPDLDMAETVTILNDMCLLAPGSLVDPRLSWTEIDTGTVDVEFRNGPHVVHARLLFDTQGDLANFVSDDRGALQPDGTLKRYRWSTPIDGWQEFGGLRLPSSARTVYDYPDGPFTYGDFKLVRFESD